MMYSSDEQNQIQFQDKQYYFHLREPIEAKFKFYLLKCMIAPLVC